MLYRAYKVTLNGYYVNKIDTVIKENLTFESEKVKSLNVQYYERTDTTIIEFTTMRPQFEYYNGKLDMIIEVENLINVIETGKAASMIAETLGKADDGFETINEKE